MAKSIVFPYHTFTQFVDEPMLKKLTLMFNDIYISDGKLNIVFDDKISTSNPGYESLKYERAVWEFLLENKIVKLYPYPKEKFDNPNECPEKKELIELYADLHHNKIKIAAGNDAESQKQAALIRFFMLSDISTRLDSIQLRNSQEKDFFPILKTFNTFQKPNKKSAVVQFLLNDIPEPDITTPWEKIIDFRNDEDARNKYLALMNWVNKASMSQLSLNDLQEEYEFLYSEYIKHIKIHKLKYNNSLLEILVNAGAGLLMAFQSGEFVGAIKNLFTMNVTHAKLMEEESKLPGKEVAYIYHVKEKFNKK